MHSILSWIRMTGVLLLVFFALGVLLPLIACFAITDEHRRRTYD
jgi:hypothetical protein